MELMADTHPWREGRMSSRNEKEEIKEKKTLATCLRAGYRRSAFQTRFYDKYSHIIVLEKVHL